MSQSLVALRVDMAARYARPGRGSSSPFWGEFVGRKRRTRLETANSPRNGELASGRRARTIRVRQFARCRRVRQPRSPPARTRRSSA